MTTQTCDSCQKLRLKCSWDSSTSFAPCCIRCKKYNLQCELDGLTWAAWAQQGVMSTMPEGFSRTVHWGPSSNAGGHPMDLHPAKQPPPDPQKKQKRPSAVTSLTLVAKTKTRLDISTNVKRHLYAVFFDNFQPVFPIISYDNLQRDPPASLLEAAILGTAARHHTAISSWRDLEHIHEVIAGELKHVLGLRQAYEPSVQTLQAFLLLSSTPELATKGHADIMSLPVRFGISCQMAVDLGIDGQPSPPGEQEEEGLRTILWKACLFQDAFISAIFGQPLNFSVAPPVSLDLCFSSARSQNEAYFLAAVEASHCLRHLLRAVYATKHPTEEDIIKRSNEAMTELRLYERVLESQKSEYTDHQYRALRIFHHNNRLLYVLGLAALVNESSQYVQIPNLLSQEAGFIIPEACRTLLWFDHDFLQSMPCQLKSILYCESRAAMLIVDVLIEVRRTQNQTEEFIQTLESAIAATRTLKDFLIKDASWGYRWSQGHTIEAVLSRLDDTAGHPRPPMSSELKKIIGLQPSTLTTTNFALPRSMSIQGANDCFYDEDLLSNVLFNSTDWNAVLIDYSEEYIGSSGWFLDSQNRDEYDSFSFAGDNTTIF
ncbi:hypothetical protein G7Y89_g8412 [Cudoniella acicularis]|uniref:Zn(2)-C6 fungal-type domain-containing protein n=1 Tax=Cudoniella acicularis TaxID=354080 RepID=A0A8H4RGL4_9HELO|nr:hypothetical protein G7Y89_g8412 [Cudoniella acicularis]